MTTGTFTVPPDTNGVILTVRILPDKISLRGVPPQGTGFFHSYYTVFRGRGIMISASSGGQYGLFASVNSFFTATSVLYLGCEAGGVGSSAGSHIEAAIRSKTVASLEAVCVDPQLKTVPNWSSVLTRSLAASDKKPSRFRIELPGSEPALLTSSRDRDLVVHYLDTLFPPAPTAQSAAELTKFLSQVQNAAKRLIFGGFYVLAIPMTYNGIDLVLSAIAATASTDAPLTYVGMLLYTNTASKLSVDDAQLPLWIFRLEPMNPAALESQRTMASARLKRYPPVLQTVVHNAMPSSSEVSSAGGGIFEEVLGTRVTPTTTLATLFRVVKGPYPREMLNMLGAFQPKYTETVDRVRGISELKVQVKIMVELLYDLALGVHRRCAEAARLKATAQ